MLCWIVCIGDRFYVGNMGLVNLSVVRVDVVGKGLFVGLIGIVIMIGVGFIDIAVA